MSMRLNVVARLDRRSSSIFFRTQTRPQSRSWFALDTSSLEFLVCIQRVCCAFVPYLVVYAFTVPFSRLLSDVQVRGSGTCASFVDHSYICSGGMLMSAKATTTGRCQQDKLQPQACAFGHLPLTSLLHYLGRYAYNLTNLPTLNSAAWVNSTYYATRGHQKCMHLHKGSAVICSSLYRIYLADTWTLGRNTPPGQAASTRLDRPCLSLKIKLRTTLRGTMVPPQTAFLLSL